MARPVDRQRQKAVIEFYYNNGENQSLTAKTFGIHRQTVGRWIAEHEDLDTYQAERYIKKKESQEKYGVFSLWLPITDVEKLIHLSMETKTSISKLIVEITSDYLGVELDE